MEVSCEHKRDHKTEKMGGNAKRDYPKNIW